MDRTGLGRTLWSRDEDNILISILRNGGTYSDVSAATGRTISACMSRKRELLAHGFDIPRAKRRETQRGESVQMGFAVIEEQQAPDPVVTAPASHIDPVEVIRCKIDELNAKEENLVKKLEQVREERAGIFNSLSELMDTALSMVGNYDEVVI